MSTPTDPPADPAAPAEPATPEPTPGIGSPPAATPEPSPAQMDWTSESSYSDFRNSLPEDLRDRPMIAETKTLQSLAEQALNHQSALGTKRLEAPQENWTDEQWDNFYSNLRPETVDGYAAAEQVDVQREGEDLTSFTFPEETTAQLREFAHKAGLSQRQFEALQSAWADNVVGSEAVLNQQIANSVDQQTNELRKDWGDQYELNHKAANEAFSALANEIPELKALMEWSPIVANHPATMKLFHRLAPLVQDMGMPSGGYGSNSLSGNDTVAGLKSQISQLDADNKTLLFSDPTTLSIQDKAKREDLLKERTQLYQKLYKK